MPADTSNYPAALTAVLEDFAWITDRQERTELLIHYADQFQPVPEHIATRPYAEAHRVPACESDAYVWVEDLPGGRLKLHFAVENPQGLSAMALATILDQTLSGLPAAELAPVSPEMVFDLFGSDLSMGKGRGLTSMVAMVQGLARQRASGS
jgi:cysteine desulfuration protein SufE